MAGLFCVLRQGYSPAASIFPLPPPVARGNGPVVFCNIPAAKLPVLCIGPVADDHTENARAHRLRIILQSFAASTREASSTCGSFTSQAPATVYWW